MFGHPAFREAAQLALVPHTVFFGMRGLWISRWLADVAHFSEGEVAYLLYLGMAAIIFGAIAVGTVTGIEYAIVAQSLPGALTGRGATCLNLLIFLGAFAVRAGFGALVGCWRPNAMRQYPAQAYQVAFAELVLLQMPGLLFFLRRRWGRAVHSGKMERQSGSPATSP